MRLGVLLIAWRLLLSQMGGFFVADEFYQAGEVAHSLVFGYGIKTWEWQGNAPIRSSLVPLILALPMEIARRAGLDSPIVVSAIPRAFAMLVALFGDFMLYRTAQLWWGHSKAIWSLLAYSSAWSMAYCLARPLSNSFEVCSRISTVL